jgi:hypothetical protein
MVYGMIQMVFGVLLVASTWIATKLTGVSVTAILGAARSQAITGPQAIKATADLAASVAGFKKTALKFATQSTLSGKNNGGGGGGNSKPSVRPTVSVAGGRAVQHTARGSGRGSYSGPSLNPTRPNIDSSRPASNNEKFAQGRTPRSQKPKSLSDHDEQN